ncbi:hypothetical protein [Pontimicrobium aquaticum]|uniref:DUF4382 domain-containing protein n=1 Tax=Pontimicrobium aquaticum TaxID=2565367 RepID=A0A4U0EP67_9FLAO|nr:hypothetical protein [Pontimicrobium aquaticum]TJY33417.1 hypothetical protein E5167_13025 [Pontimicrobium aquaticum]
MKNLKLTYKNFSILLLFVILLTLSCTKDEDDMNGHGQLTLNVSSSTANIPGSSGSASRTTGGNSDIVITDFLLNIKEFELELDIESDHDDDNDDELWDDDGYFDYEDEIELTGPFELDLMSNQFSIVSVNLPNGVYEEIEFKFDKSTDANSDLFNKSILIKGTIDATPFEYWHDFEDEVEIDFDNPEYDLTINNNGTDLTINFDLTNVFNSITGVDLSQAADGNANGIIEISPSDNDGNNALAEQLKNKIKDYIELSDD